jgi:hypothetical protein
MKKNIALCILLTSLTSFSAEVCELSQNIQRHVYDISCSRTDIIEKFVQKDLIGFRNTESMNNGFILTSNKMKAIKLLLDNGYQKRGLLLFIKK